MKIAQLDITMSFPLIADPFGDWSRDVPWRRINSKFQTTYSRTASDGRYQQAGLLLPREFFDKPFVEMALYRQLRAADFYERNKGIGPNGKRRR